MTSEVREAAGRLRRVAWVGVPNGIVEAVRKVTDCVLAESADDDELPIDEAWLVSVGFVNNGEDDPLYRRGGLVYSKQEPWWWLGATELRYADINTRGDLRRFCRLLNIDIQPVGQEQGK